MRDEVLGEIVLQLASRADASVLEIGCGTAGYLRALADRGVAESRLHGVDVVEERLAEARRRVPGGAFLAADARDLPYPTNTFDVVTLLTVLSSMSADVVHGAVAEAQRVLRPGGALVVYDMRLWSPNRAVRRVSRRELTRLLGKHAEIRSVTVFPPLSRRMGALTPILYRALATVPFARTHLLAVAKASGFASRTGPD